jgi:hypothetical protein
MVAENIAVGDRSFWNLTKIPDLPASGSDALTELQKQRLIVVSPEWRIEPTESFSPWLEELRAADAQAAAISLARAPIGQQAAALLETEDSASNPAIAATGSIASDHDPSSGVRTHRPRVKRPDLRYDERLCVAIIDFLRRHGGRASVSQVRRGLNASRWGVVFDRAIQKLEGLKSVKLSKEARTRRKWVTLLEVPERFEETRLKPKRRRHAPRSRGQTEWFQELMAEQELAD